MDAYGHSTQFVYDSANRLTEKSFWSDDSTKTKSLTLQYTIAADSNNPLLVTITDEDGYVKKYHYDILNRVFQQDVTPDKTNFYSTNYTYDYCSAQFLRPVKIVLGSDPKTKGNNFDN